MTSSATLFMIKLVFISNKKDLNLVIHEKLKCGVIIKFLLYKKRKYHTGEPQVQLTLRAL